MGLPYWDVGVVDGDTVEFGEGETYAANTWDLVKLGDMILPGLCTVKCQPTREVDKKKRHGSDGAKITVYGYLPGDVIITVMIWTPNQWKEWQKITSVLWPRAGKPAANPFDIRHPETDLWGIKSVTLVSPSSSTKGSVEGSRMWTLKCIEQSEPVKKSTTKTLKGSTVELHPVFKGKGELNAAGEPPSKTSTGPKGAKRKPEGGTH